MSKTQFARYNIGQVIRHRLYDLRGVIFDVDASSAGADSAPTATSRTEDKAAGLVYRLLAEDENIPYVACIAEHDLLPDLSGEPVSHPEINALFEMDGAGSYRRRKRSMN
jgi:heat shock protein HspQ